MDLVLLQTLGVSSMSQAPSQALGQGRNKAKLQFVEGRGNKCCLQQNKSRKEMFQVVTGQDELIENGMAGKGPCGWQESTLHRE